MIETTTVRYGPELDQYAELSAPSDGVPVRIAVLLHGGFWRDDRTLALMRPLGASMAASGWAVWNVEYRRSGPRHRWPDILDDVESAIGYIRELNEEPRAPATNWLDTSRVAVIGHSAGGFLALWAGCRAADIADRSGVDVTHAVSLGGVTDLRRAWQLGLGGGATEAIVGGAPHQVPERYRYATLDPGATSARLAVIHGRSDDVVPLGESTSFAAGAPADVDLTVLEAGHLDLIDPGCAPARSAIDCAVQRSGVDSDAQIGGA